MTDRIPERSTQYVAYTFKDNAGAVVQPNSGRYRIDDLTTGRQVRGWTTISGVQGTGTVTLTAADTAIVNRVNTLERRLVQVEGTYGVDDKARDTIEMEIERVSGSGD